MRASAIEELTHAADRARDFRVHPLGFFYLKIHAGEGLARRVHIWLTNYAIGPTNQLHLHSFDMQSLVVIGKIRNELFRYRETAGGAFMEFEVSYEKGRSMLRHTGSRGELDAIGSFETVAGARYQLKAGVVHRVTVSIVPCVTVLSTTEQGGRICSYGLADEEQPFIRRRANEGEVCRIAAALEDALHPKRSGLRLKPTQH